MQLVNGVNVKVSCRLKKKKVFPSLEEEDVGWQEHGFKKVGFKLTVNSLLVTMTWLPKGPCSVGHKNP